MHPVYPHARNAVLQTDVLQVVAFCLDVNEGEARRKRGVQSAKQLDQEMVDDCCAYTQAVIYNQRRKGSNF